MFDGDSDGLIHGIKENAIWIDHSTTDHEQNKVCLIADKLVISVFELQMSKQA